MALFVIDFDFTITSKHIHNIIVAYLKTYNHGKQDKALEWEEAKKIPPVKSAEDWLKVFRTLISDGHQIAIASFNIFSHIIPRYLTEIIGLTADEVKKIYVESWMPDKEKKHEYKNVHIANIMKHFTVAEKSNVILIDDSEENIKAAQLKGYNAILADNDGTHLSRILALSRELCVHTATNLTATASALAN